MRVSYGGLVQSASGRLGGSVFQKAGPSSGVRIKPSLTNQPSMFQSIQKLIVSQSFGYYNSGLSTSQRLAWAAYGVDHPSPDSLGNLVPLSGFNMFLRFNQLRRVAWFEFPGDGLFEGRPWITDPPVDALPDFEIPIPVSFRLGALGRWGTEIEVRVSPDFDNGNIFMMYRMSNMLPEGVSRFDKRLRLITVWAVSRFGGTWQRDDGKFTALFGLPLTGAKYGIQLGIHNFSTGAHKWGPIQKIPFIP